jgi:hypothetical protein
MSPIEVRTFPPKYGTWLLSPLCRTLPFAVTIEDRRAAESAIESESLVFCLQRLFLMRNFVIRGPVCCKTDELFGNRGTEAA